MTVHILFVLRKESYPEENAPEARVVWDELSIDENPEGFEEACANDLVLLGNDIQAHRVILVDVPQDEIRRLLLSTPAVEGKIVGQDTEAKAALEELAAEAQKYDLGY